MRYLACLGKLEYLTLFIYYPFYMQALKRAYEKCAHLQLRRAISPEAKSIPESLQGDQGTGRNTQLG